MTLNFKVFKSEAKVDAQCKVIGWKSCEAAKKADEIAEMEGDLL